MENPIGHYWTKRLGDLKTALEQNNFEVFLAEDAAEAKKIALERLIPGIGPHSVSFGGSATVVATGVYEAIKNDGSFEVLDTYDLSLSPGQMYELRRQSLLVDLFICGTNAVTEEGQLVNLDMLGNRVCGITFGPKNVIVFIGRNKVVPGLDEAMFRIKNYAAPVNTMRLDKKTPCVKTSYCEECKSPDRICNTWTITEKSYPRGRVRIVLINEDLGL